MAIVKPFKGIRPPKELVEKVESRPYDVLDSEEARAEAGDNETRAGWFRTRANIIIFTHRP